MIDSLGPRLIVPSGAAASLPAMEAGEKVVHRPDKKVLPTETVDRTAQTGPRPAFQQTYLQQLAAFWPEEPEPPVTQIDYESSSSDETPEIDQVAPTADAAPEAKAAAQEGTLALSGDQGPTIDIRA